MICKGTLGVWLQSLKYLKGVKGVKFSIQFTLKGLQARKFPSD